MWPVIVLLAGPVVAGLFSLVVQRARILHLVNLFTMLALAVAETVLTRQVLAEGSVTTLGAVVYVDALSDFILVIITAVGLSCSLYMWSYMDDQVARGVIAPKRTRPFLFLFHVPVRDGGGHDGEQPGACSGLRWRDHVGDDLLDRLFPQAGILEAGWKYLILCSVGIALALFGVVLTTPSVRVLGDAVRRSNDCADRRGEPIGSPCAQAGVYFHSRRLWHESGPGSHAYLVARCV